MTERLILNKLPKDASPKYRAAVREAKKRLQAGALCDDCAELRTKRLAVSFCIIEAPAGDFDYFVSFLCEHHANAFALKAVSTKITAEKSNVEIEVEKPKLVEPQGIN